MLQLIDLSQDVYNEWLVDDLGLSYIPFSVHIESLPILQNESR